MSDVARKLSRPITGVYVLVGLAVALLLVLIAAYHGSSSSTASACGPARALLARVKTDVAGVSAPGAAQRLQHDDDDLNNKLNGQQHGDPGFEARALPVADNLGRVVTDLTTPGAANQVATDVTALTSALHAAEAYCGFTS